MEMIMMMDPAVKCLCLLAVVAILFVTEKLPLAVTSVFAAIFCWLLGLVPIEQVFLGLADSTVVLFGGMFIVGAAMFYTGLAQDIGGQIVKLFGTGEIKLMVGIMVIAAVMSAFLSNTGTTACLIPVVIGICKEAHIPVSREMMPLAFAAGLGGTCTLIGTPPNIIANVALKAAGMGDLQFGFFEYAWIGVPITVAGILYMVFIGRHLLPKTDADDFNVDEVEQEIEANETSKTKKIICGMIMLGVIITMATGFVPLEIAAVIGALLCVITGCLSERQAYDSIDWVTIFLFAGMIPLASAMNTSGAGKLIAEYTVAALGAVARPLGSPRRTPVRLPGIRSRKERPAPGADRGRPRPEAIANPTPAAARRSPPPRTATPAESGIPAKQGAVFCFPGINAYLWPRKRLGGPPVERRTE